MNEFDLIIIGAGPAGLICAIEAADPETRICILEKNNRPGRKLLISGSGRCNVTHGGPIADFLTHYGAAGRFLRPALYGFSNDDLAVFFKKRNCPLTETEDGKIFPASQRAEDILEVLLAEAKQRDVSIHYNRKVESVSHGTTGFQIISEKEDYRAAHLVIAAGGMSYPGTGSTGDGYELAASLGHHIADPLPALTPVLAEKYPYHDCAGISIKDAQVTLYRDGRKQTSTRGDILFTHRGLSGPGILDFSRHVSPADTLTVSLLPDWRREALEKHLVEKSSSAGRRSLKSIITEQGLPERLARQLFLFLNIPIEIKMGEVSRPQRGRISEHLTAHPFTVERLGNFNEAMVTAGGTSLKEINSKTMESKLVEGLFFAGEVMDIDGDTGGYNLQAAFSTGALAGRNSKKARGGS